MQHQRAELPCKDGMARLRKRTPVANLRRGSYLSSSTWKTVLKLIRIEAGYTERANLVCEVQQRCNPSLANRFI
jgi:hypothetical protein